MKAMDPAYVGFRGGEKEPSRPGNLKLVTAICSVCQRKRNVPEGVAVRAGEQYICASCAEKQASGAAS